MTPEEHNKRVVEEFDRETAAIRDFDGVARDFIKSFLLQKLKERDEMNKNL